MPGSCCTISAKYLSAPTVGVHSPGTDLGKVENLLHHISLSGMVTRWAEHPIRALGMSQSALVTKGRDVSVCISAAYPSWRRSAQHRSLQLLLHMLPRQPSDSSLLSCAHSSLQVSSRPQRGITRPSWLWKDRSSPKSSMPASERKQVTGLLLPRPSSAKASCLPSKKGG